MDLFEFAKNHADEEFDKYLAETEEMQLCFISRYEGSITLDEIKVGILETINNVESLLDDAQYLLKAKRYPRAFALSVTAIEEIGKIMVLQTMAEIPESHRGVWKTIWNDFRSHNLKYSYGETKVWNDQLLAQLGAYLSADYKEKIVLERFRQLSLYVDYSEKNKRWFTPNEIVEEMVEKEFKIANECLVRIKYYRDKGMYEVHTLKLLKKYCSPIYKRRQKIPKRREDPYEWARFVTELNDKRRTFFGHLIEEGVIEKFNP